MREKEAPPQTTGKKAQGYLDRGDLIDAPLAELVIGSVG